MESGTEEETQRDAMCQGIGKAGYLLREAAWLDAVHLRRGGS